MKEQNSDNVTMAVMVIALAVLALSLGDALIKFTSGDFVIWQVFVLRSLLALPVLFVILFVKAPQAFALPPAFSWTVIRSLMLVVMWVVYYLALPELEFSVVAASYYTIPIFLTLFSAILIGDRIRRLGWAAVLLGFLGVLVILRPDPEEFNFYAILPLFAAMLYALAMILTRTKCREVNPIMLSIGLNLGFVFVGVVAAFAISNVPSEEREGFLLAPWVSMGFSEWLAMSLLAVAILIGSLGAAFAYQRASPAILGTVEFAYVGFAVIWGIVFFAEVPDVLTLTGIAMITIAGAMSLRQ
ncbi:MAG: DMT family transporter [Pseudomonadota bacterium]